ncbi:GGDEF domain-containing protein [Devosia sp. ZB163]|uniref:GGDEF domain-containing protein n=1 Tax=Devosia sp. ZB163 TaxID=3025938 RepID=UPI0023608667|nr:GGDEF domain-containing protein [Devosia sp. ZB163]MDC9823137.1 GGDEF domain-containing protein [Devosia sp. ZB163]
MTTGIVGIALLALSVIAAAFYAVNTIDRAAIREEIERATVALEHTGGGAGAATRLADEYMLQGARFTNPAELRGEEISLAVPGVAGTVLAWVPVRIGSEMFLHLAPLRIAVSFAFLGGLVIVLRRLYGMTRELERRRREAAQAAERDALTGLGNRLAFNNWLTRGDADREVGLLYLDLDDFKGVNDRLGHVNGDELLKVVASRLLRLSKDDDLVARIGGDEFAIIRPGPVSRSDLAELAADIGTTLAEPIQIGSHELSAAASVGVAIGKSGDPTLVSLADAALYRAKALPGQTFVFAEAA